MQHEWIWGLAGGGLIGIAGAVYLLINGRIMGASGIIGSVVDGTAGNQTWERVWFIAGLFLFPTILSFWVGPRDNFITDNLWAIAAAGILVGVGTRLANGCTSGHGICGMSRLSLRGFVATVFYIGAGGLSIILFKHLLGVV
jgi:uncharacterized membrane protein YedE/YeeE